MGRVFLAVFFFMGVTAAYAPSDFGAVFLSDVVAPASTRRWKSTSGSRTCFLISLPMASTAIRISAKRLRDSALKSAGSDRLSWAFSRRPTIWNGAGWREPQPKAQSMNGSCSRHEGDRVHGTAGTEELTAQGRIACDDMFFVHRAVLRGIGLGVLPLFLADADVTRGE